MSHMAVGDGYIWITTDQAALVKVDPATSTVTGRYGADLGPASIAVTQDVIWLTSIGPKADLYRVPLR